MASDQQPSLNFLATAKEAGSARKPPLLNVQLDGHVLLKIAQHSRDSASIHPVVTGSLLGLDVGQTLEITECFPIPVDTPQYGADDDGESYELEMLRCLREINADNNMVGWYQSSVSGSYQVLEIIDQFISSLESLERCVCLIYDVTSTMTGTFGIKAIRLADSFIDAYREGSLTIERVKSKGISWEDVFVEIPITVHNSPLAVALMHEIVGGEESGSADCAVMSQLDVDRLQVDASPLLEKNLEFLNECIDDLSAEQHKLTQYHMDTRKLHQKVMQWKLARRNENQQRRIMGEEPLPEDPPENEFKKPVEPSQLDTLLLANQMHSYATQIGNVGAYNIEKLVMVEKLASASLDK
jgi:translation initiation factor 3 subunit H